MFDESAVTTIVLVIFLVIGIYVTAFILPTALTSIATVSPTDLTQVQTQNFQTINTTFATILPIIFVLGIILGAIKLIGGFVEFGHNESGEINMERRYDYGVDQEQTAFESEILDMHDFFSKDT